MTIRLATFNCENLFARYKFRESFTPSEDGFTVNDLAFDIFADVEKEITGQAIRELDADIVALQEVESLPVLDRFNSRHLDGCRYYHRALIDCFDPRFIDVAVLSRYPIVHLRSYRHETDAQGQYLFSRDCLEVRVDCLGVEVVLYINHFKSMVGGRAETHARRRAQVERVARIVDSAWAEKGYRGNFAVLGDFNDYIDDHTALGALVNHPHLENVVERLPEDERWTHYYAGGGEYRQLDYLLLPRPLAEKNGGRKPAIMRKGLPYRAERYAGLRFLHVGRSKPKASDHAPLCMEIDLM